MSPVDVHINHCCPRSAHSERLYPVVPHGWAGRPGTSLAGGPMGTNDSGFVSSASRTVQRYPMATDP
jgi:hypothetical protein